MADCHASTVGNEEPQMILKIAQSLPLIVIVFLLAGCATQAQIQYKQMSSNMDKTRNESDTCYYKAEASDAYQKINRIYILDENDPKALKKMMINRYASKEEKEGFLELNAIITPCRGIALQGLSKVHPDFVTLYSKWYAENDGLIVQVLKGKITIGEANEIVNKWSAKRDGQYNDVSNGISRQLEGAHQSEIENRKRAGAALQRWSFQQQQILQNQQMINAVNKPRTTNCSYIGNTVSCRSY